MMLAAALVGVVVASVLLTLFHVPAATVPIDRKRPPRKDGGGGWSDDGWGGDGDAGSDCSSADGGSGCD